MDIDRKALNREILLGFYKVHILHHAGEGTVAGQWMLEELRRHGYAVSPGTVYPLFRRLARRGWLRLERRSGKGPKARREYRLTPLGRAVLALVRRQLDELAGELAPPRSAKKRVHRTRVEGAP